MTALQRGLARTVMVSLVGLVFFFGEGLSFDLTPWAQSVINAATSLDYRTLGQEQTVVVLFTEDDLDEYARGAYPIPYEAHMRVIRTIARARPRAIFMDFAFVQRDKEKSPTYQSLRDAVCDANREGIGMFVVDTSNVPIHTKHENFDECAMPVGAFVARGHVASGVLEYPKWDRLSDDEAEAHPTENADGKPAEAAAAAPSCTCKSPSDPMACTQGLSAAYALWLSTLPCPERAVRRAQVGDRMAVIWPAKAPAADTAADLCGKPDSFWKRLHVLYQEGPSELKRTCPYSRTFTVGQLIGPGDHERFDDAIRGRTVLYGAQLEMTGDVIRSPVFAELPAIHYHAVAFDNLVSFGGRPKQSPGPFAQGLFVVLLVAGAAILSFRKHAGHETHEASSPERSLHDYVRAVRWFLLLVMVVVISTIVQVGLDINQPEYLLLTVFVLYLGFRFFTERFLFAISIGCFLFSIFLYFVFAISLEKFLAMIFFFEIVHWLLHTLSDAARRVDGVLSDASPRPKSWTERGVLALLEPFRPEPEKS